MYSDPEVEPISISYVFILYPRDLVSECPGGGGGGHYS